jgi:D-alanyl-D-alanine dipeptidase
VDLTLAKADGTELDMGTIFDFFHERSHTNSSAISADHRSNRQLLKSVMEKHGFKNFAQEWWHFSLVTEAFPGQSFDFDVD